MTPLEIAAFIFTALNVYLAVKQNIWTWPTGIVSVILFFLYFWREHNYLNGWLQGVYLVLSIHGWYEWLHGGANKSERHVSRASALTWTATTLIVAATTVLLLVLEHRFAPDAKQPFLDALTTAVSLGGQYMLNMKYIENWLIWAVIDVVYVYLFLVQHAYLFALLYAAFIVLCIQGLIDWRKSLAASA